LRAEQLTALSHHLLAVSEQEKASLARELHDELGSNLTAIRLDLLVVLEKVKHKDPGLTEDLRKTLELLKKTYGIKRRIIENLHPGTLENLGLAVAVRTFGNEVAQRSGLQIDVDMDEDMTGIDAERAIAMYRIVQESLTNTVKYAKARRVVISLIRDGKGLLLRIADDGVGFAEGALGKSKSHGIVGMHERAMLLGGVFHIDNDQGTRIEVFLPNRVVSPLRRQADRQG
jgi:signal transduction histidine kinase